MAIIAIKYTYSGDTARAAQFRPAHRAFFGKLHDAGTCLFVGPFADDGTPGALLMVRADSPEAALELLKDDPFLVNGVIVDRVARPWTQVRGPFAD